MFSVYGPGSVLVAFFVSFGRLSSIRPQALPRTVKQVVRARQSHLHSILFRKTPGQKLPFTDRSLLDFPAMWYVNNITHVGIMPCHMADWISRALARLYRPARGRSTGSMAQYQMALQGFRLVLAKETDTWHVVKVYTADTTLSKEKFGRKW